MSLNKLASRKFLLFEVYDVIGILNVQKLSCINKNFFHLKHLYIKHISHNKKLLEREIEKCSQEIRRKRFLICGLHNDIENLVKIKEVLGIHNDNFGKKDGKMMIKFLNKVSKHWIWNMGKFDIPHSLKILQEKPINVSVNYIHSLINDYRDLKPEIHASVNLDKKMDDYGLHRKTTNQEKRSNDYVYSYD